MMLSLSMVSPGDRLGCPRLVVAKTQRGRQSCGEALSVGAWVRVVRCPTLPPSSRTIPLLGAR
jgi:hypothetical protein